VRDVFTSLIISSVSALVRDKLNERLTSVLSASNPSEDPGEEAGDSAEATSTSEEVAGFHIVRAIAARVVDHKRTV
jgi:hypothetical protein